MIREQRLREAEQTAKMSEQLRAQVPVINDPPHAAADNPPIAAAAKDSWATRTTAYYTCVYHAQESGTSFEKAKDQCLHAERKG